MATYPEKTHLRKRSIFDKNYGLTPLQILECLVFFQTLLFWYNKHSFLSRLSKNNLLWLDILKNTFEKKVDIFFKNLDYRNIGVVQSKNWMFFKGVNPWFWPKVDLFWPFCIVCENIFKRGY